MAAPSPPFPSAGTQLVLYIPPSACSSSSSGFVVYDPSIGLATLVGQGSSVGNGENPSPSSLSHETVILISVVIGVPLFLLLVVGAHLLGALLIVAWKKKRREATALKHVNF